MKRMDNSEHQLTVKSFLQREGQTRHSPYEQEYEFYECVRDGDVKKLKRILGPICKEGTGKLSKNEIQNMKYHFVISVALIARYCIEGGMDVEDAYNLSDYYIMTVDECTTREQINGYHYKMFFDYTERMRVLSKSKLMSKNVLLAVDYIYEHLHAKIYVEDIAAELGLNPSYLSRLFHKETGLTFNEYITNKRIEAAKNMLKYSDYSAADIGNYLAFSSHSHFICCFKKHTNMTPKQYRNKYFRRDWTYSEHL